MRKFYFVMCLLFLLGLINAEPVLSEESNILRNPGFEEGDSHLDYWRMGGNATFVGVQSWQPYEGKWSLGIGNDLSGAHEGSGGCVFQVLLDKKDSANLFPVSPGQTFSFEMWMKTEDKYRGKASLKIEFFDYDRRLRLKKEPIAVFESKVHTGEIAGKWIKESVTGVAPPGTVSISVSCLSEDMDAGSRYVFFDAGIVKVTRTLL